MSISNNKIYETPGNDFTSNNIHPQRKDSDSFQTSKDNMTYFQTLLVVLLAFSNNLAYYLLNSAVEILVIGIVLSFFIIILLLIHYITHLLAKKSYFPIFFPIFYFLAGLCFVFEDPDVIRMFLRVSSEPSYMPGLLTLIFFSITVKEKQRVAGTLVYIKLALGTLSFCLVVSQTHLRGRSIYLFIILLILLIRDLSNSIVNRKRVHSLKYEEIPIEANSDLDFEEITYKLQITIQHLTDTFINSETLYSNIRKSVINIKQVAESLQKKSNIYSVKVKNVTKDLDEQDKVFIEESCFGNQMKQNFNENTHMIKIQTEYPSEVNKLSGLLKNIGRDWNFNSFFLSDCCNQIPLQVAGFYSFHKFNLDEVFKIPEGVLRNFLMKLEATYKPNPYHNSVHAADVMNSHLFLVNNSKLFEYCTNIDVMAGIIAALGHDAGHPARNNRFLMITKDELAIQYNDISVLEMLHSATVFSIIMNSESNIFQNLTSDQWSLARKMIVEMILATDMSKHFDLLGQFRGKHKVPESFDLTNNELKIEILRLIIKAADIGHAAKDIELHEKWCRLVVEEFYTQGDIEKQMGLTVSMYCDRETTDISKSQAGFIKSIVSPLFSVVNFILQSEMIETYCIEQLKINENHWIHRRKTIRGRSLIHNNEEYVNKLNNLGILRSKPRKPSLPDKYLS